MNTLAGGLSFIDLQFQGVPRVIATVVVQGKGGVALIDPGPSSALPELRRGLELAGVRVADLTAILLTHTLRKAGLRWPFSPPPADRTVGTACGWGLACCV